MTNKSYRIKYNSNNQVDHLKVKMQQDFDFLEVLSLKISQEDVYKLYTSDYGVVVGRILANDGFGIPNAKISIFIKNQDINLTESKGIIYPYDSTDTKSSSGVRYNLLPSEKVNKCHQNVGTFPSKRLLLDNNTLIEVFEDYYKYTTTTNQSGDYMLFGIPVGQQKIHIDIDLSDIGALSQAPRDLFYKGYSLKQFDSPNKFKKNTNLDSLGQIITENDSIFVYPFWGDSEYGEIAISKKDINIQYKFEPTCVFMGSMFTDSTKSYIGKSCKPTKKLGKVSELVTSQGSIEMIRETIDGKIEKFDINGTRLIDNNGVWCYQIPMNLDYVVTDEYGNLVPTSDPSKGIPTRTKVRFRMTLDDNGDQFTQTKTGTYLVPNNPNNINEEDYEFNENCKQTSLINLMWNKVYSVKNYIPRIQKGGNATNRKFIGLKSTNYNDSVNPIPYNNIWVDMSIRFIILCVLTTMMVKIVGVINNLFDLMSSGFLTDKAFVALDRSLFGDECSIVADYDYFVPFKKVVSISGKSKRKTIRIYGSNNILFGDGEEHKYLIGEVIDCIETSLSKDNEVVNFDLTNDWINGSIYAPKFQLKTKKDRNGNIKRLKYCNSNENYGNMHLIQTCAPSINSETNVLNSGNELCLESKSDCYKKSANISLKHGILRKNYSNDIFYYKTNEWETNNAYLFPTNIILLGSLNENDMEGIPLLHQLLPSTSFKLPPDTVDVNDKNETYQKTVTEIIPDFSYPTNADMSGDTINHEWDLPNTSYYSVETNKYYKYDIDVNSFVELTSEELAFITYTYIINVPINDSGIQMSGIDWGNKNIYPNGLFLSIQCLDSDTIVKTCINASRICEIGVDFDEHYNYSNESGINIEKNVDGYISTDEISDGDSRSMFSTLNINKLKTSQIAQYNHQKYVFNYNYPDSFDGRLKASIISGNGMTSDVVSNDYKLFRIGENPVYYVANQFPKFENSFYFYFGTKEGSTALDIFNNQYFVPCDDLGIDVNDGIIFSFETVNLSSIYENDGSLRVYDIINAKSDIIKFDYVLFKKINNDYIIVYTNTIENVDNFKIENLEIGDYRIKVSQPNNSSIYRILDFNLHSMPSVMIYDLVLYNKSTATAFGNIGNFDNVSISENGFCWTKYPNIPTISDNKISSTTPGFGDYSLPINNLTYREKYNVRAYGINVLGEIGYSSAMSLDVINLPIVTTNGALSERDGSDYTKANVIPSGTITGGLATEYGYVYMLLSDYYNTPLNVNSPLTNKVSISHSGYTGNIDIELINLTDATYIFRAYAINELGIYVYGGFGFINKLGIIVDKITNITNDSAIVKSSISNDMGTITERGVCWAQTPGVPSKSGAYISNGSGTGDYSTNLTSLLSGTTYNAVAYLEDGVNPTKYSIVKSFTTLDYILTAPSVSTYTATDITETTAKSGGYDINANGQTIVSKGVCWSSTNSTPTISDDKTNEGGGNTAYVSTLINLIYGSSYYYAAYVTNDLGETSYGEIGLFVATIPISGVFTSIDIVTYKYGSLGYFTTSYNEVLSGGGSANTVGICYIDEPTFFANGEILELRGFGVKEVQEDTGGNYIGTFGFSEIGPLNLNTQYLIRAYALNESGIVYGNIEQIPITF